MSNRSDGVMSQYIYIYIHFMTVTSVRHCPIFCYSWFITALVHLASFLWPYLFHLQHNRDKNAHLVLPYRQHICIIYRRDEQNQTAPIIYITRKLTLWPCLPAFLRSRMFHIHYQKLALPILFCTPPPKIHYAMSHSTPCVSSSRSR